MPWVGHGRDGTLVNMVTAGSGQGASIVDLSSKRILVSVPIAKLRRDYCLQIRHLQLDNRSP